MIHRHTLGWTSNDGENVFALGWLDVQAVTPAPADDQVYPVGTGAGIAGRWRKIAIEEEDMILAVIRAFLHIRNL